MSPFILSLCCSAQRAMDRLYDRGVPARWRSPRGCAEEAHTSRFASLLLTGSSVSFLDASLTVLIQVLLITKVMLVFRRSQHYRIWTPPAPCTSTQLEGARAGNQAKEAFWDQEPELQLCGQKQPSPGLSFPIRSKMGTAPPRAIQR